MKRERFKWFKTYDLIEVRVVVITIVLSYSKLITSLTISLYKEFILYK